MNETTPAAHHVAKIAVSRASVLVIIALMIGAALATRLHLGLALALWSLALVGLLARLVVQRPETIRERANIAPEAARHTLSTVLQAVTDALDMPAVILRADGMILQQNEAADRSFGHLSDGMHVSARWRSPSILDMIRDTVATGLPNQVEHSERLPSERVYITRIAPVVMPQGAVADEPLYLLSFKDISELRRLDRMRSDFVANASHELRTPLASLRGFLETLQGPAKNDPKAQERFIVIMLDQANRMSRLVDDLLSLSRLEMKAHLAPEDKVDLVSLLGHVRDSLQPLAEEMDVELSLDLPDGPALVLGDRDELVQVFENLIENACKYGQDGKRVDVGVKAISGKAVEVSVVDYGPGIPPEHVPRLTERFYRVSLADSRSKKGTGLGLAIVKHILTRHRARLIIKSEPGAKTEFTVRF